LCWSHRTICWSVKAVHAKKSPRGTSCRWAQNMGVKGVLNRDCTDSTSCLAGLFESVVSRSLFDPLKTKRRSLYLKTQSVPRCKRFTSRL
jgi:hypothetical protein